MNRNSMPALKRKPINWKTIAVILLVLGIAGYNFIWQNANQDNPAPAEKGPGVAAVDHGDIRFADDLTVDLDFGKGKSQTRGNQPASKPDAGSARPSNRPYLSAGKNGSKESPAGLVYTSTRHGEHRTTHVLRHARDIPDRNGSHGVFEVDQEEDVFRLIDEAYRLIKKKSKQVKAEPERDGKRAYVVDMKRKIGYKGGKSGKRAGHPSLYRVKLVLANNRVITAYPY